MKFEYECFTEFGKESVTPWFDPDANGVVIETINGDFADIYEQDIPKLINALQQAYEYIQQHKEKA